MNLVRVASFNVQRSSDLHRLSMLISKANYDFVFIQEPCFRTDFIPLLFDLRIYQPLDSTFSLIVCRRDNVTSGPAYVKAGPFQLKWSFISQNNLQFNPSTSKCFTCYTCDVIVQHNDTKQYFWLLSLYSPCEGTSSHIPFYEQLYAAIRSTWNCLILQYVGISIIWGGDFNFDPDRVESRYAPHQVRYKPWEGLQDLSGELQLTDAFTYTAAPGTISLTNSGGNGARLDRFYTSPPATSQLFSFSVLKKFSGSHKGILITLVLNPDSELKLGRGRYVLKPDADLNFFIGARLSAQLPTTYAQATGIMSVTDIETRFRKSSITARTITPVKQTLADFRVRVQPTYLHALRADTNSGYVTTTDEMLKIGKEYYSSIYKAVEPPNMEVLDQWLSILDGERLLSPEQRDELEGPFTLNELEIALLSLNKGAAPGKDGISVITLREHWNFIGPILVNEAELLQKGVLPVGFKNVVLTLIRKKSTPELIADYRPISLSLAGLCVIAKAMNTRILTYADKLIGKSQRGFLPSRRIDENTTEVLSLIRLFRDNLSTELQAIVLLDQSKAFDRLLHPYLRAVLLKYGFGPKSIALIMAITSQQWGQVEINKSLSRFFPLSGGVRQGNPLLPTLYILSLEPLLAHINDALTGIKVPFGDMRTRYSAYADDVAVFISNYADVATLQSLLEADSKLSGSKINANKSVLYTFNPSGVERFGERFSYQVKHFNDDQFKYLGIDYKGVNWTTVISHQIGRMIGFDLTSYPYHLRAQAINSLVLPAVIYPDLVSPISDTLVEYFDKRISSTFFKGLSSKRIYGSVSRGGYGLLKFLHQLLGHRAKKILELFDEKACDSWAKQDLINRLQHSAILSGLYGGPLAWATFLVLLKGKDRMLRMTVLEAREVSWLTAWTKLVEPKGTLPSGGRRPGRTIVDQISDLPSLFLRGIYDSEGSTLSGGTFHSIHKKMIEKSKWIDNPLWTTKYFRQGRSPTPQMWHTFWRSLLKLTSLQPWQMAILWHFYHGFAQGWMWRTHRYLTELKYVSFYFPGCVLCLSCSRPVQEINSPADWLTATSRDKELFNARIHHINECFGCLQHMCCICPVAKVIFRLVNKKPHPYSTITDLLPPPPVYSDCL